MPVLVFLNGAPAAGKSTLARSWTARHQAELPLALDLDVLRAMLGGWEATPTDSGLAARAMAIAAIRVHLASGRDVIVPQYLGRSPFIDSLRHTAESMGASFVETVLLVDTAVAERRFADRATVAPGGRVHHAPVIHGDLGGQSMAQVIIEFEAFLVDRPAAVLIDPNAGNALDQLERAIAAGHQEPG